MRLKKPNAITEAKLTHDIRKLLKHFNIFHWKVYQTLGSQRGVSDIIGCHAGKFFAIEVKRPGCKPTDLQKAFLDEVEVSGGIAILAHEVADVIDGLGLGERVIVR